MNTEIPDFQSVCVYCGSRPGSDPTYMTAGRAFGRQIADHGLRLVYGGGTKGIMGAVAAGALAQGGAVTGIIPEFLIDMEATRHSLGQLSELVVTKDMHARKHKMFERSNAFVAFPGGIGTLEEIVEVMTWGQLGQHEKPMVFANINGFWDPMMELLRHMTEQGFVHTAHRVQPLVIDKVENIIPAIRERVAELAGSREGDSEILSKM
ncbi:TIGR00730 family Rossman fold protein [Oryzifoliimicrobium ureilyticus]|uniref:LOG family protein n=1 Tax=Oryzifoliimicrobium ureilyticus TaxID=3113724 RepID=UPI0030764452